MGRSNNFSNKFLLMIFILEFFVVVAKLRFNSCQNHSSLWGEFFLEGYFDLDILPVAIVNNNTNDNLNTILPVVMKNVKHSMLIFDEIPNYTVFKASFLIFEKSNLVKFQEILITVDKMFHGIWTQVIFWFLEPISNETEKFVISQCFNYYVTSFVISSPVENTSSYKIVSTNNILNVNNNLQNFTFNQNTIKNIVRILVKNMEKRKSDFEGAVLRVKAHPKYLMLQVSNMTGLFGVDASAIHNMANLLNFKVKLIMGAKNHFGNTFPNGSLVSSIYDLGTHKIDLNLNRHVAISRPEVMILPALDNEEFCFILPYFRGHYKISSFVRSLTADTWVLVLVSVLLSAFVWRFFNLFMRTDDYPVLSLLQSLLTTKIFKIYRPFQVTFLVSWFAFVFILVSALRGTILKIIIKPVWMDKITTMEELLKSDLKIKNRIGIFQVARPNSTLEKLLAKSVVSNLKESDFEFRTSAYFTSKYFRIFLDTAMGGKDHYYTIPECLTDCYVSYLVAARSPYFLGLEEKVLFFQQHGFYIAWLKKFNFKSILIQKGEDTFYFANSTRDIKERPFSVQDLMFAFYIQTVGLLLSSVVFLCEITVQGWVIGDHEIPFIT